MYIAPKRDHATLSSHTFSHKHGRMWANSSYFHVFMSLCFLSYWYEDAVFIECYVIHHETSQIYPAQIDGYTWFCVCINCIATI